MKKQKKPNYSNKAFIALMTLGCTMMYQGHLDATEIYSIESVQQRLEVKGQVVDVNGEPIIGASVKVKGTSTGTITDMDGFFTLDNMSGKTLNFIKRK